MDSPQPITPQHSAQPVNAGNYAHSGPEGGKVADVAQPILKKISEEGLESLTPPELASLTKHVVEHGLEGFKAVDISSASGSSVKKIVKTGGDLGDVEIVVSFYKQTTSELPAQYMEQIMYDLADIAGMKDMFALTVADSEGSVQTPQSGMSVRTFFDRLNDENNQLPEDQAHPKMPALIDATLATIFFGMFDAHAENIIVTKDGNFKFFDNTRSMPHSNNAIINRGAVFPSYRSGLIMHPYTFAKLHEDDVKGIKENVASFKEKIPEIKAYFEKAEVQENLKKMPVGWMDPQLSIRAMEERVKRMEKALSTESVHLFDLICAANPDYKFQLLLHLAMDDPATVAMFDQFDDDDIQTFIKGMADQLGTVPLYTIFDNKGLLNRPKEIKAVEPNDDEEQTSEECTFHIDPEFIWKISHEYDLIEAAKKLSSNITSQDVDLETIEAKTKDLGSKIYRQAEVDNKDAAKAKAEYYYLCHLEKDVAYPESRAAAKERLKESPNEIIFFIEDKGDESLLKALYTENGETVDKELDYRSEPGKINDPDRQGAPPLSPGKFRSFLDLRRLPYFHEVAPGRIENGSVYFYTLGENEGTVTFHMRTPSTYEKRELELTDDPQSFVMEGQPINRDVLLESAKNLEPLLRD